MEEKFHKGYTVFRVIAVVFTCAVLFWIASCDAKVVDVELPNGEMMLMKEKSKQKKRQEKIKKALSRIERGQAKKGDDALFFEYLSGFH